MDHPKLIVSNHQTRRKKEPQIRHSSKASPNKFLDSHPNLVKNWGRWEVFIFYFLDCFKNKTELKETFNAMKLSKLINDKY